MTVSPGTRVGPYEIVSPLGAGGMGEVYKARDTRLDRTVAIKILPTARAGDPEMRGRFEREARAVAALDHPHICAIYDVGDHDGTQFIVMQHLEGETLAARLARTRRPLPLDHALQVAIQIADALDKAHRAGITHRDLKPANIMLTRSGAKLLDFGLAKLRGSAAPISMSAMTRLTTPMPQTATGTILGTVHYMAPEQVEGRDADARADIWALGVVLYEMLTATRPFDGESAASVIGAILKDQPRPPSARVSSVPPGLDRLVDRCLQKDPDDRWQSARDLTFELGATDSAAAPPIRTAARRSWSAAAAILVAALAGAAAVWLWTAARNSRASDLPVVQHASRVTHERLFSEWPTWSPDGRMFAFSANHGGDYEIYVRRVEGGQEINVTNHPADDVQPAFSPDGTSIAFVSTRSSATQLIKIGTFIGFNSRTFGGDVWVTPTLGGAARRIGESGNFPVWDASGRAVLYVTGIENQRQIIRAPIDGTQAAPLLPAAASKWEIIRLAVAPNGRWITFETSEREVFAMPANGGTPTALLRGSSHAWDGSGRRIFYTVQEADVSTRIEAADVVEEGGRLQTRRISVAGVSLGMVKDLAVSADGRRLVAVNNEESVNLTRVPLSAAGDAVVGPEDELSDGLVRDRYAVVSPDGRRIAVGSNRTGEEQLWVVDTASRRWDTVRMPELEGGWVTQACWTRDSQRLIAMRYARDGTSAFWSVALDGSSAKQLLSPRPALPGSFACDVSPDNRRVVYVRLADRFSQLFALDLTTGEDRQLTRSPSHKYAGAWSPDGQWIAFSANTAGTVHVWRIRANGAADREEQLTTGRERMTHFFYSPDGQWLYVSPSHRNVFRIPADGGSAQQVTRFPESGLFLEEPTISPDGRWLVYGRGKGGSSLWLLTVGSR